MKKIFIMCILLVLTACFHIVYPVFPVVIKNLYYDEIFVYIPYFKYNNVLYFKKGDILNLDYNPNISLQDRRDIRYFIYEDKSRKKLITSFSEEDLKIGTGHSILSFDQNGIFKVDNSDKVLEWKTYSRNQTCRRKKNMLDYHGKNTSQMQSNIYSLYSDNMAKSVFNDTKIYLKKIENIYLGDIIINDYKIKFIPIGNENKEKQQILQNYFDTLTKDTLISDCNIEIYDEKDFKSLLFSDLIIRFSVLMKND